MTAVTTCRMCGTEPLENARFCHGCGSPVAEPGTPMVYWATVTCGGLRRPRRPGRACVRAERGFDRLELTRRARRRVWASRWPPAVPRTVRVAVMVVAVCA
jgi:hypothetical protein